MNLMQSSEISCLTMIMASVECKMYNTGKCHMNECVTVSRTKQKIRNMLSDYIIARFDRRCRTLLHVST